MDSDSDGWRRYAALIISAISSSDAQPLPRRLPFEYFQAQRLAGAHGLQLMDTQAGVDLGLRSVHPSGLVGNQEQHRIADVDRLDGRRGRRIDEGVEMGRAAPRPGRRRTTGGSCRYEQPVGSTELTRTFWAASSLANPNVATPADAVLGRRVGRLKRKAFDGTGRTDVDRAAASCSSRCGIAAAHVFHTSSDPRRPRCALIGSCLVPWRHVKTPALACAPSRPPSSLTPSSTAERSCSASSRTSTMQLTQRRPNFLTSRAVSLSPPPWPRDIRVCVGIGRYRPGQDRPLPPRAAAHGCGPCRGRRR